MRICVIVCIIMCMFHYAHGAWTPIGPYGGDIYSIVISQTDGDYIWVMSHEIPAKIARTSDAGATWTTLAQISDIIQSAHFKCLTIDPSNHDNLFVVSKNHVFKSTDGGLSWQTPAIAATMLCNIAVHPTNSSIVVAVGDMFDFTTFDFQIAFYQSTDAGETWTHKILDTLGTGSLGFDIAIAPSNPDVIYISGLRENAGYVPLVYKSTDGGVTFDNVADSLPTGMGLQIIAVNPADENIVHTSSTNNIIFRTTDGGTTWSTHTLAADYLHTFIPCSTDPDMIYCGGEPYVYVSTDGGITWAVSDSGLTASKYYGVATHPSDPNIAYAGCSTGVYKTTDCGVSWSPCNNNLNLVTINDFCIAPTHPSIMYVTTEDFGMYKSTNYGTSWSSLPDITNCGNICDLAVNPYNPNVVLGLETHG